MKHTSWSIQGLTSVISMTMVLVLLGVVLILSLTARQVGDSVRESLTLTIVLEDNVSAKKAEALYDSLQRMPYVSEMEYISAEQALQEQIEYMGIDPTDMLGANPFSISMEMKVKAQYAADDSLQWIAQQLHDNELVDDVTYQKELAESINHNLERIFAILLVVAGLLVLVSISLIHGMVQLSIQDHRFQIHAMKLVGARWNFIRRPFMLQSLRIGLLSATLAMAFIYLGVHGTIRYDEAIAEYITLQNMLLTAAGIYACGLFITLLCTYLSVTRYLYARSEKLY